MVYFRHRMKRRKIPLHEARMCDPRGSLIGKRSAWPLTRRVAPTSPRKERGEVKKAASAALAILATALMLNALASRADSQTSAPPVELRILAINDFHGNLLPPTGGIRIADPDDKTKKIVVPAGGAEHMATLVRQLRQGTKNTIFVAAGDLIGASPFLSAMFHDEPSIESLSMMGLEVASVGNHEFDEGKDELLRMQNGGCHPSDKCLGPHPFLGARFHYLAASTVEKSTGKTVFPPYEIKQFDGIPVAFIGLTLKGTPDIVSPVGVAGLEFKDEADTVNALVPELKAQGVEAIVVLIHEGGFPAGDYNECPGISGPIVDIISAKADNLIVRTGVYAKDPEQTALLAAYDKVAAPIANRAAGSVTDALSRTPNDAGESPLGDIIADAQLAATSAETDGGADD